MKEFQRMASFMVLTEDQISVFVHDDVLEGVLQYECKEMLKVFINEESYFRLDELNERIRDFDYGYYNDKNKPSPISVKTLNSNTNSLKQKGIWLFDKVKEQLLQWTKILV